MTAAAPPGLAPIAASSAEQDAYRRLQRLNQLLLSQPSATLTLERWCNQARAQHAGSAPELVTVQHLPSPNEPLRPAFLDADTAEPIRHRRVRLRHAGCVLSEADNWYVPSRLTRQMNDRLATTDMSFGRIVQSLGFRRTTLSADLLWQPGNSDARSGSSSPLALPALLLRHRALLTLPDGTPFSEVLEVYTRAVLTFETNALQPSCGA